MPAEIDLIIEMFRQHTEDDRENFKVIRTQLDKIDANVSSLMQSRSFGRGMVRPILWLVGSAIGGGFVAQAVAWAVKAH